MQREAKKTTTDTDTRTRSAKGTSAFDRVDSPLAAAPEEPAGKSSEPTARELNRASQQDTVRAARGITPTQRMRDLMSRMQDIEADPTDAGYPDPDPTTDLAVRVDTDNLPAVAQNALAAAGTVTPPFHQVANLPGNMSRGIRTMGKQLFRMFTRTPTEDIYMIGNVMGQGPNSARELNAVPGYLRDNAVNTGVGDLDLSQAIPGYRADVNQFKADGIRWLVVRDEFGEYVYAWPEADSLMFRDDAVKKLEKDR